MAGTVRMPAKRRAAPRFRDRLFIDMTCSRAETHTCCNNCRCARKVPRRGVNRDQTNKIAIFFDSKKMEKIVHALRRAPRSKEQTNATSGHAAPIEIGHARRRNGREGGIAAERDFFWP